MNITTLKKEAAALASKLKAIVEVADKEDRDLTEAEEAEFAKIDAELDSKQAEIARKEKMAERLSSIPRIEVVEDQREKRQRQVEAGADDRTQGFAHLADFAQAVLKASVPNSDRFLDERLAAPSNFHTETGDSSGTGYLVPAQYRQEIWDLVFNDTDLTGMVDMQATAGNSVELTANEETPWGATGVQSYWRSEGSQMTATKLAMEGRTIKLHELYSFVTATGELLEDAPRLNGLLTRKAADAIRWKASDSILYGTGSGQPLGYFNAACKVAVAKESGQAADTVVAANVAKMYSRQLNPGRGVWFVNHDVMPQLVTMTLGDQPIWTPPSSGFVNAPGGALFGRPVFITDHAKTLGDEGDIQFIDPMGYFMINKAGGVSFASSIHLYFDYNIEAFRWIFRLGGAPYLSAAVSPANGSSTRSHFITLAARA